MGHSLLTTTPGIAPTGREAGDVLQDRLHDACLGIHKMLPWPQYVCAILEDPQGRLLLESRPDDARLAAGRLTCFGGRREEGESPEQCLGRELREELAWEPRQFEKRVELWVAGELVAWFYHAVLDVDIGQLSLARGYAARLVTREELSFVPLSPWHAAVLGAWLEGKATVHLG